VPAVFGIGQTIARAPVVDTPTMNVWTHRVVVAPPVFDRDLCLLQCVEDFAVELLIAQLAIKALVVANNGLDVRILGEEPGRLVRDIYAASDIFCLVGELGKSGR
jgi:hypothetical protein